MRRAATVLFFLCAAARGATLDVPGQYTTIQAALDAAHEGDTIVVQPGSYHEALTMATPGVALVAAGSGGPAILDGSGLDASVIHILASAEFTRVEGFTVTGGTGTSGGGILVESGHVVIRRCDVVGNTALGIGGGIAMWELGIVEECTIWNNVAGDIGGGVYGGVLRDSTLRNNRASSGGGAAGVINITGCLLEDNKVAHAGGGAAGSVSVRSSIFRRNESAIGGGFEGWGKLEDCLFEDNRASDAGGGASQSLWGDNLPPTRCRFVGNRANRGGALYLDTADEGDLFDCSFAHNRAESGAAIGIGSYIPSLTVRNCSFLDNGLHGENALSLQDCILRGNFELAAPTVSVSWCDVEGGWPGVGNFDVDPAFVDPVGGDLHLQPGSPCADAGTPGAPLVADGETDLDGEPRLQGGRVDLGADETTADCNGNGLPDWEDVLAGAGDCDGDTLLDECEPWADCNANGVIDSCDIASGASIDCNGDGVPDECQSFPDCNRNGVPDICETIDCNGNGIPDDCDIASGFSLDTDGNGVPDECHAILHVPSQLPTLQAAFDLAAPHDTILVEPGVLSGPGNQELIVSKDVFILGATTAEECIVDGLGQSFLLGAAWSHVTLGRLTFRGGGGPYRAVGIDFGTLVVADCVFQDNQGGALGAHYSTLDAHGCRFTGNTSSEDGAGLRVDDSQADVRRCTFSGNEVVPTFPPLQVDKGGAISVVKGGDLLLRDSILHGDAAVGGNELHVGSIGSTAQVAFCDVAGGADGVALNFSAVLTWGEGNIDADPLFKDAAAGDVRLTGGSPCIDSGDPAGVPDADGTQPDMGALPFQPFEDLGFALAGALGEPHLQGAGTGTPGERLTLTISGAAPSASATLVLGASLLLAPFQGGVMLPAIDALVGPLPVGADGTLEVSGVLPASMPSGFVTFVHGWLLDGAGWAATNGLSIEAR